MVEFGTARDESGVVYEVPDAPATVPKGVDEGSSSRAEPGGCPWLAEA